ncbi:MAG: organoarsenical effux MFS transporter ArsJ [Gammaproteobacteria bacterium]|nr:organoarsenical effux MFS transporter ArsJ [Gammaproteobacteria bacterium]
MPSLIKQYLMITSTYWVFTITDGALRMLVILFFHQLGYNALDIALLFLFYEFFGVVTNLIGGWLGAKIGLNRTMHLGVLLQIIALAMLTVDNSLLGIAYVMFAQALSGIAKDLNKMSAKSSIKFLLPKESQQGRLYHWVAFLTGSKNALKGAGFFIGALLLSLFGFQESMMIMMAMLIIILIIGLIFLTQDIGKSQSKPKFKELFSKSRAINILSAARLFLFASRDVWFVVAIPVYFQSVLNWEHTEVGAFMAIWVIGYGIVQALAPKLTHLNKKEIKSIPSGKTALFWASLLIIFPLIIALQLYFHLFNFQWLTSSGITTNEVIIVAGLILFGIVFAINSSVHSFLILAYARNDGVSLDVGFYYMANAAGRLVGTILSGSVYVWFGLEACLLISSAFLALTAIISMALPHPHSKTS